MFVPTLASLLTAAVLVSSTTALLDKPGISPPFNEAVQVQDLTNDLPAHSATHKAWDAGWIPEGCLVEANEQNLKPSDFEIWNVYYSDCSAAWAVCRHKQATYSWDAIINTLGKIPVGMRQYLANLVIVPGSKTAYTRGTVSTFFPQYFDLGVACHEFSHILDSVALKDAVVDAGYPAGSPFSETAMWQGAYEKDSAVPTEYARTNWVEDFADSGRYAISDITHPGGLAARNPSWTTIRNQIGAYRGRLEKVIFPSGGKCTGKIDTTKAVPMTSSPKIRAMGKAPRSTLEGTDVVEIIPPEDIFTHLWVYNGSAIA